VVLQVLLVVSQAMVAQVVPVGVQSMSFKQATHLPLPSQTLPPLSVHALPEATLVAPQQPMPHVGAMHVVEGGEQSAGILHAAPASQPGIIPPVPPVPPVLAVLVVLLLVEPPVLDAVVEPPQLPGTLQRSTEVTSSQPVMLAASAPTARSTAVRSLTRMVMTKSSEV
jgi:hypothetical protein